MVNDCDVCRQGPVVVVVVLVLFHLLLLFLVVFGVKHVNIKRISPEDNQSFLAILFFLVILYSMYIESIFS